MSKRVLIAGIGNIFLGDDAFGVEVVRRLSRHTLPEAVRVVDFGIRSYDLAFAIMDGYDVIVLVDAVSRGEKPGTVYLIEPEMEEASHGTVDVANAHSLNPAGVLQMVRSLGGRPSRLYLVGCEPAVLDTENGEMGLSASVEAAIPRAMEMIHSLLSELVRKKPEPGLVGGLEEGNKLYA
jgi:hydrogenase maturation protease